MRILAIQNRMGIGDMVIFLPFLEAISKKYNSPLTILVKENSKAKEYLGSNQYIQEILTLDRDNKHGKHDGIIGSFYLANKLRTENFDKVFIFNSSLRFNLICKLAGIKKIHQYPLFRKKKQHLIKTAQSFIKKELNQDVDSNPQINLEKTRVEYVKKKYNINNNQTNILLGIGGSGPTKRIPSEKFLSFMKMASENYNCKFFLATGMNEDEQIILNQITNSEFKEKCVRLDDLKINEILPIIKNCKVSICNDSSFSHLSAALNIPTIVLLSDTPFMYGSYSPNMYPIIPDGEENVTHNTLGKEKINPKNIFKVFKEIIS